MDPKKAQKRAARLFKLENQVRELDAQDILSLKMAHTDVARCTKQRFMGSGLIITITGIGGKQVMRPAMISDGLSAETIAAIQADIERTHALRLGLAGIPKPSSAKKETKESN